ncbi:MAG: SsrA-binding protein SmpB [Chloroflexota bacterium]|nr:SsrA-binding protein SmpB [Chloroflexota bacterium]
MISRNRKASHEYSLERSFQAGLVLTGPEIKSIRANNVSLQDGFVQEREGELWLMNVHVKLYEQAGIYGFTDPLRPRKLLLHKKEIAQIVGRMRERGYTVVPTMMFLQRGRAKIEIALAKGKKLYDKRADNAQRDSDRQLRRVIKEQSQE